MTVTQDQLGGRVFTVGQYSSGAIADLSADPLVYTEQDAHPYAQQYGTGDITIDTVTTSTVNGMQVTTIKGKIATTTFGPVDLTGTVLGNDVDDILVNVSLGGQSGYFFLTNAPATQAQAAAQTR